MRIRVPANSCNPYYNEFVAKEYEAELVDGLYKITIPSRSGSQVIYWYPEEIEVLSEPDPLARLKELVSELPNDWSFSDDNLLISAIVEELLILKGEDVL